MVRLVPITRLRLALVISLIATWWIAYQMRRRSPDARGRISSHIDQVREGFSTIVVNQKPNTDHRVPYNTSKLALLIEPRPKPHLVPLILHMMSVVPQDWRFLMIGSDRSIAMVEQAHAIQYQQKRGKIDLVVLPQPWAIQNKENVSRLLADARFYDVVLSGVDWMLKYESESILCANSHKSTNEFLDDLGSLTEPKPNQSISYGGLSLQNVSELRRALSSQNRFNGTKLEDERLSNLARVLSDETPPRPWDLADVSSYKGLAKPMGYHVPDDGDQLNSRLWRNAETRKSILEYCPELHMILDMKLERERCPPSLEETNDSGHIKTTTVNVPRRNDLRLPTGSYKPCLNATIESGPGTGLVEAVRNGQGDGKLVRGLDWHSFRNGFTFIWYLEQDLPKVQTKPCGAPGFGRIYKVNCLGDVSL
ncbi:hypothetical protein FALBO_3150 [Fusarium albosuccineum]|uniref:DUF5672 domain-containing protein n=1 Tax=Fusarium albosuccineum TaxID=1237068 RepID=A0A8H4LLR4_9HYPO|nr:hypothetical protein FALBO_3150 [Fusarium albosuccineum]